MLDTSDEFRAKNYTDRIQLIYYEDGRKKQQVITAHELTDRLKGCSAVMAKLVDIQREVIKRASESTASEKA